MDTSSFVFEAIVLPIENDSVRRTLITRIDKIDSVIEITNPDRCVVVVKGKEYCIGLPAQKVCDKVYGGIG